MLSCFGHVLRMSRIRTLLASDDTPDTGGSLENFERIPPHACANVSTRDYARTHMQSIPEVKERAVV